MIWRIQRGADVMQTSHSGKIIGVGGIFFKCADPDATRDWYTRVLGLAFENWGGLVFDPALAAAHPGAGTVFSPFKADTDYFGPAEAQFMINLMVDDLDAILSHAAEHGVVPVETMPDDYNGRFAHLIDPDGRKLELWQPRPAG
jgi:catechol 2,3-dioxygenase-like lactoylglutathione lyase family enzyme